MKGFIRCVFWYKGLTARLLLCGCALSVGLIAPVSVEAQPESAVKPEPSVQQYEYQLPLGCVLGVILQDDISTETAVEGQPISAIIMQDIYIGTTKVLSKDDRVLGWVKHIEKPLEGRNAILELGFDELILNQGVSIPISAKLDTGQPEAYFGGELTPGTMPEVIGYRIYRIGKYGRVVYRGPRAMGTHVHLKPGDRFNLILKEPVVLYVI